MKMNSKKNRKSLNRKNSIHPIWNSLSANNAIAQLRKVTLQCQVLCLDKIFPMMKKFLTRIPSTHGKKQREALPKVTDITLKKAASLSPKQKLL